MNPKGKKSTLPKTLKNGHKKPGILNFKPTISLASKKSPVKKISNNQALIKLALIGEYQLGAEGVWISETDGRTAKVSFNTFAAQATKFLGQSDWSLPELKIPIIDFLRNEALWITSYLDEDTRIGRGRTGNLFVFRR